LSGGEKILLALVKLLLDPPNLLLMDEPTTHLDMASIDALAYALDQFQGTLIFISHDVYFIRALANHVVHVNAGQLTRYPGGYQYYLDKTKAQSERAALTSSGSNFGGASSTSPNNSGRRGTPPSDSGLNRKDQKRLEAEQRQARSRGRKAQQEIVSRLEAEIFKLETHLGELTAELENPATYEKPGRAAQVNRELVHAQERLTELNPEWEAAAGKLAAMN
jgi:ATP-binding cassette subfamily F protein 3